MPAKKAMVEVSPCLVLLYLNGVGVEPNHKKALNFYLKGYNSREFQNYLKRLLRFARNDGAREF